MGGEWLSYLFFACVSIIAAGLLWFRALRPMLESFGVLTVNASSQPAPTYVTREAAAPPVVPPFHQERAPEREPGTTGTAPAAPQQVDGRLYTADQISTLTAQAEERGAARALGLLLGRGLLEGDDRGAAMELIFGPRGRKHQRVRPIIEAALAEAQPAPAEARLVPVNGGEHFIEL